MAAIRARRTGAFNWEDTRLRVEVLKVSESDGRPTRELEQSVILFSIGFRVWDVLVREPESGVMDVWETVVWTS